MKRATTFAALLLLAGCSARKPVQPQLTARHCPSTAETHVATYQGQPLVVCVDKKTNGIFNQESTCNPYQYGDCDEARADKPRTNRAWWKFWHRTNETDTESDKD
jgi:hypothetical protein